MLGPICKLFHLGDGAADASFHYVEDFYIELDEVTILLGYHDFA